MNDKLIMKDGKPHKIADVVMLPTEKDIPCKNSIIKSNITNKLNIFDPYGIGFLNKDKNQVMQHLYILSSEEIKEGDWVYHPEVSQEYTIVDTRKEGDDRYSKGQHPAQGVFQYKNTTNKWYKKCKKIIATTDESLDITGDRVPVINDVANMMCRLPRTSDDFIKAFVKAHGKIDKVLVEYDYKFSTISEGKPGFPEDDISWWNYKLKVSPDNTVTIRAVEEEKTSWSREEVLALLSDWTVMESGLGINIPIKKFEEFIKQNL